jgi:DNA-binding response OmpR family regulator
MTDQGKTLLVVEDEEVLREFEVQVLDDSGYRVLQAECVAAALRVAAAATPIHLLLTDLSLPDGNGINLAHQFRVLHPQAAILLVSGSVTGLEGNAGGPEPFTLIGKPFAVPELLRTIRALLADTAAPPRL